MSPVLGGVLVPVGRTRNQPFSESLLQSPGNMCQSQWPPVILAWRAVTVIRQEGRQRKKERQRGSERERESLNRGRQNSETGEK